MIKIKLYTDEQYVAEVLDLRNRSEVEYTDRTFEFLADGYSPRTTPPFRDEESVAFLKNIFNIEFIKNEWFSVIVDGMRSSLFTLSHDVKYGLSLIYFSKKGIYLSYKSLYENVWEYLASLPFDILIVAKRSSLAGRFALCGESEYTILNYPYQGRELEVSVKNFIANDDFYTPVPEAKEYGLSHGLSVGADGKYYSDRFSISYAFKYYWKNDIEGIIRHIKKRDKETYLVELAQEYSYFQFVNLVNEEVYIGYLDELNFYKRTFSRDTPSAMREYKELCQYLKEKDGGTEYKFYLWLRDELKIVNHMFLKPKKALFRKLPIFCVDRNTDGSYYLSCTLTVKHPSYGDILYPMLNMCYAGRECFALVVDTEELLYSVNDIDSALCGFKISPNRIEAYNANDALVLFGESLKEAYSSDNYTVSKDFY